MNDVALKLHKIAPRVLHILAVCGYAATIGFQTNPDLAGGLGLTPAMLALAFQWFGSQIAEANVTKAAAAIPAAPLDSDGEQIDQLTHLLSLSSQLAYQRGKMDVVKHLANTPGVNS